VSRVVDRMSKSFNNMGSGREVRIALVEDESILVEAVERVRKNFSFNP
jgi:hypothetical protein